MDKVNGIFENRFTGWKDVTLTAEGIEEAKYAGNAILKIIFVYKVFILQY